MSLTRLALRISAVQAIIGQTYAGANVHDSQMGAIDDMAEGQSKPIISVYIDDSSSEGGDASPRDFFEPSTATMIIEVAITTRMEEGIVGVEYTDANMEMTLDVIERQIRHALSSPDNSWSEIWRSFTPKIESITTLRGHSAEEGVRVAGRRIEFRMKTVREPVYGADLGPVWSGFLAALDSSGSEGLAALANNMRALVGDGVDLADWKRVQQMQGNTLDEARSLLYPDFDADQ